MIGLTFKILSSNYLNSWKNNFERRRSVSDAKSASVNVYRLVRFETIFLQHISKEKEDFSAS